MCVYYSSKHDRCLEFSCVTLAKFVKDLKISFGTLAKSIKEAVADPWLTLITEQQVMVCADLCSGPHKKDVLNRSVSSLIIGLLLFGLAQCCKTKIKCKNGRILNCKGM